MVFGKFFSHSGIGLLYLAIGGASHYIRCTHRRWKVTQRYIYMMWTLRCWWGWFIKQVKIFRNMSFVFSYYPTIELFQIHYKRGQSITNSHDRIIYMFERLWIPQIHSLYAVCISTAKSNVALMFISSLAIRYVFMQWINYWGNYAFLRRLSFFLKNWTIWPNSH